MIGEIEFKTYMLVLVAGEYTELPVIVCGTVAVDSKGCSEPEITSVWHGNTDEEIALTRCWHADLSTARQELLAAFSQKIDHDYEQYCADMAEAFWEANRHSS